MHILSMAGEYALLSMLYLALRQAGKDKDSSGKVATVEEISRATGIPMNFLSKIMILLSRAGLVRSTRGHRGGCELSKPSEKITALDVIRAAEGDAKLSQCTANPGSCPASPSCPYFSMWVEAQDSLEKLFRKYTLHSLLVCVHGLPEEKRFFASLRKKFGR